MADTDKYARVEEALSQLPDDDTRQLLRMAFQRARDMDTEVRLDTAWSAPMRPAGDCEPGTIVSLPDMKLGYLVARDDDMVDIYTDDYIKTVKPDAPVGIVMTPMQAAHFVVTSPLVQRAYVDAIVLQYAIMDVLDERLQSQPAAQPAFTTNAQQALLRALDRGGQTA